MNILREFHENIDILSEQEVYNYIGVVKKMKLSTKNKRSFNSLLIKYFINKSKPDNAFRIIANNDVMKRDYFEYIKFIFKNNNDRADKIFKEISKKFTFLDKDLTFLIENNLIDLLQYLDGLYIKFNSLEKISNLESLKFYNPINTEKKVILEYISKKLRVQDDIKYLTEYEADIIIDGGNISYYDSGQLNYKHFETIIKMIKTQFSKPLLIIHTKHKNNSIVANTIKKYNIRTIFTPYGVNDDYYILYCIIYWNSYVLTLDYYKDHIFEISKILKDINDKFRYYINEKIIKYTHKNIESIPKYSNCIQFIDNYVYIPTNGGFVSYKINLKKTG